MALRQSVILETGISIPGAYRRIENIVLVSKTSMVASVRSYADIEKPAFHDSAFVLMYDISGSNPYCQAYSQLKALPEFSGAVDC